jgi:nuclear pore complex protein Nup205
MHKSNGNLSLVGSFMCLLALCFIGFLGKITINGKSAAVNADFARQAIFLSQQLDCSEKYVAGVLHHVMSENTNIGPVQCMELTVATFHQERRDLVDSLRFLFEATEASELPDASIVYQRLGTFVKAELLLGPRSGVSEPTMARKVFKAIEQLDALIGKADAARKNAGSNTVVPSGQGEH